MRGVDELPVQGDLLWPTLQALERLGGSASVRELDDGLAADLGLPDACLEIPHGDGPRTEFGHRAGWARTRLRRIGAVDNPSRGALVGRADKGLFITTGRFTRDAGREAVRDGALAVDLIDGEELCRLLRDRRLGH